MTSIAADSSNRVHISHYGDGTLEYMTNSGEWESTTVENGATSYSWGGNSIATDSGNNVHIVYYDHSSQSIKYATNKSGDWTVSIIVQSTTNVPTNERTTVFTLSLAMDQNDNLHVAYMFQKIQTVSPYATLENFLRYATTKDVVPGTGNCREGSDWNCSTVDSGGMFPAIAIDAAGAVRISHYYSVVAELEETAYTLKHAKLEESGSWTKSNVLTLSWSLQLLWISMDIDSNNKSHITYTTMNHFVGLDEARVYYVREK